MKFGAVAVEECAGAILAHGLRVADGVLKKGRVLGAEDVAVLRDAGYANVVVARLETDDVAEDEATAALAAALAGDGVGVGQPLEALGSRLVWEKRCEHSEEALTRTLGELLAAEPQMALVVGASAIVDRRDVVPAPIVGVGGRVDHFGIPVDPGNLLLLAHRNDTPVLGLPGCARSPKFNGFDQVLERLPVGPADIMGMGVGGLLKETHERTQPRLSAAPESVSTARSPRIAALVLAVGATDR